MYNHSYVPTDLFLEGLLPGTFSQQQIITYFFISSSIPLFLIWIFSRYYFKLNLSDTLICTWLLISGLVHLIVEGPVVYNQYFYQESGNFVYDLWKEYSHADSRYITRDSCVIGIEAITSFVEGPACLLLVLLFIMKSPFRHILTVVVVTGELYGTILYFLTSIYEDNRHSRTEFIYFWFYFVTMNAIWIVVPALIIFKILLDVSKMATYYDTVHATNEMEKKKIN